MSNIRWLVLSLLTTVVIATVCLGIGLGFLYRELHGVNDASTDEFFITFDHLSKVLDEYPERDEFIALWQKSQGDYTLDFIDFEALKLPESLIAQAKNDQIIALENDIAIDHYKYLPISDAFLKVTQNKSPPAAGDHWLAYTLSFLFYVILMAAMLLWLYPLMRSLLQLKKIALDFGKGNLSNRVKTSRLSYIADIENEFNNMADRIERLVRDIKLMGAGLSHELRSPLARLRFGFDSLVEAETHEERVDIQNKIDKSIDEVAALVDAILNYARIDSSLESKPRRPVELVSLVKSEIDKRQSSKLKIDFESQVEEVYIEGDRFYLSLALSNLLENACNHGYGRVKVKIQTSAGEIILSIEDDGAGIDPDFWEDLFTPFVRGTTIRHGFGLGLAIVKRVLDWHRASIKAKTSSSLGGAGFYIYFRPQVLLNPRAC